MAIRNIVTTGDETLRKVCFPVEQFDEKLCQLLDDMKETVKANEGAGLAAPQVGILRRVVVVDVPDGYFELVNPRFISKKGEQRDWEGCLSIPNKRGIVSRPLKVTIVYQDREGKEHTLIAKRFTARAICHELDHLDGILYVDKAEYVESAD